MDNFDLLTKVASLLLKKSEKDFEKEIEEIADFFSNHTKSDKKLILQLLSEQDKGKGWNQISPENQKVLQSIKTLIGAAKDREEFEKELIKSRKQYLDLFENSSDGIFLVYLDGINFHCNKKASEMLGYSAKEINGMSYKDLVSPDGHSHTEFTIKQIIEGKLPTVYEKTFVRKDGSLVPVEISISVIFDYTGKPEYIQSEVRDISFRKNKEG